MSRTTISAALVLLCLTLLSTRLLAAPVSLPSGAKVGIYPLQLPDGPRAFTERLSAQLGAQLKDGAAGLPRLGSVELIAHGACMSDEGGCLAAETKGAGLQGIVAGRVQQSDRGFGFELHLFTADGRELASQRGAVEGGPLDLASGLENGLCELLGGAPCVGTLTIQVDAAGITEAERESSIFIDGKAAGPLGNASQLALPVGRHLVRAGKAERRVRVAYHREAKLLCDKNEGALALEALDENGQIDGAANAVSPKGKAASAAGGDPASAPSGALPSNLVQGSASLDAPLAPRTRAGRLMLAAGGALLMTATGVELYARAQSNALDNRYRSGQLTAADSSSYGKVHTAGVAALLIGATGVGALAVGGIVLWLSPGSAAVQGNF